MARAPSCAKRTSVLCPIFMPVLAASSSPSWEGAGAEGEEAVGGIDEGGRDDVAGGERWSTDMRKGEGGSGGDREA